MESLKVTINITALSDAVQRNAIHIFEKKNGDKIVTFDVNANKSGQPDEYGCTHYVISSVKTSDGTWDKVKDASGKIVYFGSGSPLARKEQTTQSAPQQNNVKPTVLPF